MFVNVSSEIHSMFFTVASITTFLATAREEKHKHVLWVLLCQCGFDGDVTETLCSIISLHPGSKRIWIYI